MWVRNTKFSVVVVSNLEFWFSNRRSYLKKVLERSCRRWEWPKQFIMMMEWMSWRKTDNITIRVVAFELEEDRCKNPCFVVVDTILEAFLLEYAGERHLLREISSRNFAAPAGSSSHTTLKWQVSSFYGRSSNFLFPYYFAFLPIFFFETQLLQAQDNPSSRFESEWVCMCVRERERERFLQNCQLLGFWIEEELQW
jgi:hypothetical protein